MKPSAIFVIALLLTACGVARPILDQDNTKVEVRVEREIVVDTAWVELPVYVDRVETLDTISVLENRLAVSSAVVSGGVLRHSLETKAISLPVPVESKIVYKDSIVFRDRVQTVTKEVEKPLSGWQQAKLRVGGVCFLLIILYGLYLIIHFIYKPNSSKL